MQQEKTLILLCCDFLILTILEANIENLTTYSLHPGVIATELSRYLSDTYFKSATWMFRNLLRLFLKTPEQGAETTIYCSVNEDLAKDNGLYYSDCNEKTPSKNAQNMEDAKRLWDVSLKMVGLAEGYDPFSK